MNNDLKEMRKIWYLLKCPKEDEVDYVSKYQESVNGLQEILRFQYQCMMRYGGRWHLEKRAILPGYIFLSGNEELILRWQAEGMRGEKKRKTSLKPCEAPYLKILCQEGNLVGMSKGIIKNGEPIVISGPLWRKEQLIRKIDRHKRTAEIGIPLEGQEQRVTVGLEIYEKQM